MDEALNISLFVPIWMETQTLITIGTPFLVFGSVFIVLIMIWD